MKHKKIIIGGVVLLVLLVIAAASSNSKKPTTKTAAATTSSSTKQSYSGKDLEGNGQSIPINNSQPAQPKVLLDLSGSGQKQTDPFTTGNNWTLDYTFDCSNFGSQGNFQTYIENVDGSLNTDTGANDLQASGNGSDHYYDAGQHYLKINSECSWHVIVKG